ncbi:hypothetical protein PF003_g18737 [Phytophthora fragariae]|nr:hypothetical protein PF003_g18737 [Phytophthora fragariae]
MYSADFRWRAVVLHYAYSVPCERVARILGISGRYVRCWYELFKSTGHGIAGGRVKKHKYAPSCCSSSVTT